MPGLNTELLDKIVSVANRIADLYEVASPNPKMRQAHVGLEKAVESWEEMDVMFTMGINHQGAVAKCMSIRGLVAQSRNDFHESMAGLPEHIRQQGCSIFDEMESVRQSVESFMIY